MLKLDFCKEWTFAYGRDPEEKKTVTLPHDAMITDRRGPSAPSGSAGAYFYGDLYVYEKAFDAMEDWRDKNVTLEVEGAYLRTTVYVNGQKAAFHPYGYTGFFVPLDPFLKYGESNLIRIEVDGSRQPNSRWYSGGGLYRPVNLYVQPKEHIALEGVRVFTEELGPVACKCGCTREYAKVRVLTETVGAGEPRVELLREGEVVAAGSGADTLLTVEHAKTWNAEHPWLYECRVTFGEDVVTERFGIRTLRWSPKGFFVNGVSEKLRGGCIHHDNGILGSAAHKEAEYRRVRILKEQGFNAIRSAHNPCSKFLLEAADEMGMYILDEAFDMWYTHKSPFDNADYFEEFGREDIYSMVKRDVNHPSVIGYSMVNEPSELSFEKGQDILSEVYAGIKKIDATRPVTAGLNLMLATAAKANVNVGYNEKAETAEELHFDENGNAIGGVKEAKTLNGSAAFNKAFQIMGPVMNYMVANPWTDKVTTPIFERLDMAGYNYGFGRYKMDGKKHPERLLFGSETLPMDLYQNWNAVEANDYICGDFMWTSWDYLGEVGIGGWSYVNDGFMLMKDYPWVIADCGAVDLLGNPGNEAAYAGILWKKQPDPQIFVRPVNHPGVEPMATMWRGSNARDSWSWQGCEGNEAYVEVYSRAPYVQLWLNGRFAGLAKTKKAIATFKIPYEPGVLKAEAIRAGKVCGSAERVSAGNDLQLTLTPESTSPNPGELVFVHVDITDGAGTVESNADCDVTVTVEGGELLAFGSAIQATEARYHTGTFPTYYGRALAVVRVGEPGETTVTAVSDRGWKESIKI